ncbi:MAG: hypothetical protein CVU91_10080 [Firmicutes bacterium HGW-Firmicutes-16]|nr:MAG: hypothetical protein CVU91_10080 [Firmicutes bacterium HGW-Firmicutes-16]
MKKPESRATKRAYPVMPYLIGLFVTVIVLVLLSYLVELRNKDELGTFETPQNIVAEYSNITV